MPGYVLIALGIFIVLGALMEWEWYVENSRARFFTRLLGYQGMRIFYMILGSLVAIAGVLTVSCLVT